jgi:maltose O-acetyltransferase
MSSRTSRRRWRFTLNRFLVNSVAASSVFSPRARYVLLRFGGLDLDRCTISPGCFISGPKIRVGRDSFLNRGCFLDTWAQITIGERCMLAMGVTLVTSTHEIGPPSRRAADRRTAPIRIGDGCWLGANVTVLPGVTIGEGCVIAAGAVVAGDCEPNGLYGGVPARRLRDLPSA